MVDVPKTPPVQVTKGTGPGQLDQGDATLQNDQAAMADQLAASPQGVQPPPPDESAPIRQTSRQPVGNDAQSQFLYGATHREAEPLHYGLGTASGPAAPPAAAQQWLPIIESMANDPTAPAAVQALYRLLANAARG